MANTRKRLQSRGRTGGRGGASGYDFQDIYVALQLTKLLMEEREPILEVLWEKRAIDFGSDRGAEPVHVDDAIIRRRNGRCVYVQVKESAPSGGWSATNFVREGVASQFWNQWHEKSEADRPKTTLRFASGGDVSALAMVVDDALRSGTPSELLSAEASKETAEDVRVLAAGVSTQPNDPALLTFLKSLHFERLPSAGDLLAQVVSSLTPFGGYATELATRLVRVVAMSKHVGPSARASHTRPSLIEALEGEGVPAEAFVAAGLVHRSKVHDVAFWDSYRAATVREFRTFRVYGLQVERAVFADLPSLFVPLRLAAIPDRKAFAERDSRRIENRRESLELLLRNAHEIENDHDEAEGGLDIGTVLRQHRRFALLGGPGSGKTTFLKWLALVSALGGEEGERMRTQFGLPAEPLTPVFVRFRSLAERIRARGLEGLPGRVGLVSEFLAADFEAGRAGRAPSRMESLEIAEELLSLPSCIFLFDALDEVADPSMRSKLFAAVADLIAVYQEPRVVVSSRPYAFREENSPLELAAFEPLALSRTAQRTFARQWYKAVRSHVGDALADRDAEAQAADLAKAAAAVPDLAENPLLLSILALVHFNRQGLPVERGVLYDHATLAMLGHWERDAAGRNLGEDAIPLDWARRLRLQETAIRRVVESLARDVQLHGSVSEFEEGFVIDALTRGLEVAGRIGSGEAVEEARLLLKLLVERSGLIQERSPGVFAFVHLSFQDYLTARWYVGTGEKSLRDLAALASEERHAEVIRFTVAILRCDHRAEADERAMRLILEAGAANPVLAASCLLEAPHLTLGEEAAEDLARRVWDCTQSWRYHLNPRAASRLMWILLAQTTRSDALLMEFLALEPGEERRRPREGPEEAVSLLTSRPPAPMSRELNWVLRQLAHSADRRSWIPFWSIASLALIESSAVRAQDHVPALVRLLGEEHWARDERGNLGDRAERILRELHAGGSATRELCQALEAALTARDDNEDYQSDRIACAAAKLLISFSIESTPDAVSVLVLRGLRRQYRHDEIGDDLTALLKDDRQRERTISALVGGLSSDNNEIRRGCARILRQNDVCAPTMALLLDDEQADDHHTSRLRGLLSDPTRGQSTLAGLADALWDDEPKVAWRAARTLCEHGMQDTPGLPQTLVRVGLSSESWRNAACECLRDLKADPRLDLAVRAALLDAMRGENKKVATASARFLIDLGEAHGDDRLSRIIKASLRDEGQVREVAVCLRAFLVQGAGPLVVRVLGEYFGAKEFDITVASTCAVLLAEAGHLETPSLTRALVFAGLANTATMDEAASHLERMLEDPRFVTDTRKALSDGLAWKNQNVVWGCVQCLWKSGSRTDPRMAAALTRAGLPDPKRREKALLWLVELLGHPRTAAKALAAADEVASEALNRYSGGGMDHNRAWEIARCLLEAGFLNSEHLAKALVVGGFGERARHDEVLTLLRSLVSGDGAVAQRIEKELWSAVGAASANNHSRTEECVAWGAAHTLIETKPLSVCAVLPADDEDTKQTATEFVRTLLRESGEQQLASKTLKKLVEGTDSAESIRKRLGKLLRDDDGRVSRGAARTLLLAGEIGDADLPLALIHRGEGWWEERVEVTKMLDDLRSRPLIGVAVMEALQQALWGADGERAWSAAVYLMDAGDLSTPGLARALLFANLSRHGFDEDVEIRIRALLANSASRAASLNALRVALLRGEPGRTVNAAPFLVLAGEPLYDQILAEFDSEHLTKRWPLTPLSALALSGRVDEARSAARIGGFQRLLHLLEPPVELQTVMDNEGAIRH